LRMAMIGSVLWCYSTVALLNTLLSFWGGIDKVSMRHTVTQTNQLMHAPSICTISNKHPHSRTLVSHMHEIPKL
jgi:hypothetical protein